MPAAFSLSDVNCTCFFAGDATFAGIAATGTTAGSALDDAAGWAGDDGASPSGDIKAPYLLDTGKPSHGERGATTSFAAVWYRPVPRGALFACLLMATFRLSTPMLWGREERRGLELPAASTFGTGAAACHSTYIPQAGSSSISCVRFLECTGIGRKWEGDSNERFDEKGELHTFTDLKWTCHSHRALEAGSAVRCRLLVPLSGPMAQEKGYFSRLAGAFGWRYVAAVCLQYGGNQGIGNRLNGSARSYYLLDSIGLDSAQMGSLSGFAGIPWQLKSLFGLLSDTLPIDGYHRSPYMMIGGTIGMAANAVLAFAPPGVIGYYAAALLFLACNLNVALADVMIDATVAEQTKRRPELGAELQALCWGALGGFGTFAFLFSGWALEHTGPRMLFACSIGSSACAAVPGALRWLGEPTPRARGLRLGVRDLCGSVWGHRTKRLVGLVRLASRPLASPAAPALR